MCGTDSSPQVLISGSAGMPVVCDLSGYYDGAHGWRYMSSAVVNARTEVERLCGATAALERGFTEHVFLLLGTQIPGG